jgi:hypothetical protein
MLAREAEHPITPLFDMKTESLIDRLVEISKRATPPAEVKEDTRPRLKRRDQRSARAEARNAAHRRALDRGIPKQSKFAPKRRWTTPGFRTGWRPPPGASVLDRIVRSMQPGHWYARRDLGNLANLNDSERIGVRPFSHGYLTRRRPQRRWRYRRGLARGTGARFGEGVGIFSRISMSAACSFSISRAIWS